jgi:hypothetical protein
MKCKYISIATNNQDKKPKFPDKSPTPLHLMLINNPEWKL